MKHDQSQQGSKLHSVVHSIEMPGISHEADTFAIRRALDALNGVINVECSVRNKRVVVNYRRDVNDFYSILEALEKTGFPPNKNWIARKTHALFQYLDHQTAHAPVLSTNRCHNQSNKH